MYWDARKVRTYFSFFLCKNASSLFRQPNNTLEKHEITYGDTIDQV